MISSLAQKISLFFLKRNIIEKENYDIYAYGFELMLSTLVNAVVIIIISIATHRLLETLIFICGFIPLRVNAGGFHANSHLSCIVLFLIAFISFIVSLLIIPQYLFIYIIPFLLLVSVVLIYLFSPVEHQNKKFTDSEKLYYKRNSRVIVTIFSILAIVILYYFNVDRFVYAFCFGIFLVALAVIVSSFHGVNSAKALK